MATARCYSATRVSENVSAVLALGAVAATAKAGQLAVRAYKEWQTSQPEAPIEEAKAKDNAAREEVNESHANENRSSSSSTSEKPASATGEKRENFFANFFDVGSNYYEGGFEEKMTPSEAALILGVRQSSTPKRIKEAHRKLLVLNHPDTGGSTYLSGKINQAKELLLKGERRGAM